MFNDFIQIAIFILVLLSLGVPLGSYIGKVLDNENTFLTPLLKPVENLIYRISGIDKKEMNKKEYMKNLLIFNFFGGLLLFLILICQKHLPLNPMNQEGISIHLAFNTAVSFMTNTNWQSYSGEQVLSYLSQMAGLTVQNFLSAATGIAVMAALIRGLGQKRETLGNFWVDLVKSTVYVLLPLSILFSVFFISQGVIQNLASYKEIVTLEGQRQVIPMGPAASQIAIKQLGTNGGGYFGVNSAHPFENPTPLSNFAEMLAILLIPVALVFSFGRMIKSKKQALAIFSAMFILFLIGLTVQYSFEKHLAIGNMATFMEGKETRFGLTGSVLWSQVTTSASNGSVNSMLDSFSPIAGLVAMLNIMSGEVIFGGAGAGLYGILMYVIITVFIAGLMVGRTPEYLGKKIEKKEMIMSAVAVLAPSFIILVFSAATVMLPNFESYLTNRGPHGLSEIVYAFSSAAGNNGSAFAGLSVNNGYFNTMLGLAMLVGRFAVIIPVLEIAESMGKKEKSAVYSGTFRTDTPLFTVLLISIIFIIGLLTFFPVIMLGPIAEHLLHIKGAIF